MSMYFMSFFKRCAIFCVLVFCTLKSTSENIERKTFNPYTPRYSNQAWYIIELANIPIGTAIVSLSNLKNNPEYDYSLQFASRIGASSVTSEIFVHAQKSENTNKQIIQKFSSKSYFQNPLTKNIENIPLLEKYDKILTEKKTIFFNEGRSFSFNDVFEIFPKYFLKLEKDFTAQYSNDHLLKTASLKLEGGIPIEFKRINETQYRQNITKNYIQRVDLDLLNVVQDQNKEIDNLLNNLSDCRLEMQNLIKSISKQMPYESYLMYRRIINLDRFCTQLETNLTANSNHNEENLSFIASDVKNLLKEDASELPHSVFKFSERTLYYNDNVSFLWPRITTVMVKNAVTEMTNLYRLDFNRKSLLNIQLKMAKMQPQAVVRVNINQLSSPIRFVVQTENDEKKPYYLDGTFFTHKLGQNLAEICGHNSGNVGIDFHDLLQPIINSSEIRGVWDLRTKLLAARVFAIQAIQEKSCSTIYFRVNPDFAKFFQKELDTLRNESLSLETSLLLSNYGQKKLWVIPGKYQITIWSIINEKIISVQEFVVEKNTQTNVVANVS